MLTNILKIALTALLLGVVAYQLEWPAVLDSISRLSWWIFPIAVLLYVLALVLGAYRWYLLLANQGVTYGVVRMIRPYFVGAFFNNFLPSSTGGDAYRIYHIHSEKHGAAAAFSPVIIERVLGLVMLLLIALIAAWFYQGGGLLIEQVTYAATVFFLGLATFLIALATPAVYWPVHGFLERWAGHRIVTGALQVAEACHESIKHPVLVLKVLSLSALLQILLVVLFGLLAWGIGSDLPINAYLLVTPLILLAAGLPISVGGLGVREAAAVTLFSAAGMLKADAAAVAILYIPVPLLASLPGLFFFLARHRRFSVQGLNEGSSD